MGNNINNGLNGDFDHDEPIMQAMSDEKLEQVCKTDPMASRFCHDPFFWTDRIRQHLYPDFPHLRFSGKPKDAVYQKKVYYALKQNYIDVVIDLVDQYGLQGFDAENLQRWLDIHRGG